MVYVSEVSKTTVRFSDLLEGLSRIQKLLHSPYTAKGHGIGKGTWDKVQAEPGTSFLVSGRVIQSCP